MSRALPPTDPALDEAAARLRAGELVGMPTETVYGLAADGLDPAAVARIYAAKDRPRFNPLILHVAMEPELLARLDARGIVSLDRLDARGAAAARSLIAAFWPGPLSLVLPRGSAVPDLTTAGLDTVAVRSPDHPVAQALIARVGRPLAAPSANRSGRISPTTAQDVLDGLAEAVALVLDGGACPVGVESTVVHVGPDGTVTLLRPGAVGRSALEAVLHAPVALAEGQDASRPRSPGMTERHYAPDTPFLTLPGRLAQVSADPALAAALAGAHRVGLLCWSDADARAASLPGRDLRVIALSPTGDPAVAARRLFAALRQLDALGADVLLAEPCPPAHLPDDGLVHAIRDRLARASRPLRQSAQPGG